MEELRIEGKTLQEWIDEETRKRKTTFWGTEYEIEPPLLEDKQGDGQQLVYVMSMDQRPHYWLMLIDSKTDVDADDFDIEDLLQPLEEGFGRHPESLLDKEQFEKALKDESCIFSDIHDYEDYEDYNQACQFPAVLWGGGFYGCIVNFGTNSDKI